MHHFCVIFVELAGQLPLSKELAEKVVQSALSHFGQPKVTATLLCPQPWEENCHRYKLTSRETEIVTWICQGLSYPQIGEKLYISDRTVGKHVEHIFEKVGVCNKVALLNKLRTPDI